MEQGFAGCRQETFTVDTVREATTVEVVDLKRENKDLMQAAVKMCLRNDWINKSLTAPGVLGQRLMYTASENLAITRLVRPEYRPGM